MEILRRHAAAVLEISLKSFRSELKTNMTESIESCVTHFSIHFVA